MDPLNPKNLPASLVIPKDVVLSWSRDFIFLQGPSGTLIKEKGPLDIAVKENRVYLLNAHTKENTAMFARLQNLRCGVSESYRVLLRFVGVGFRVREDTPGILSFKVGHTHPVTYKLPVDVSGVISPNKGSVLLLKGVELQRVNQVAMEIRSLRKPNVYTGKGIRLASEVLVLKSGKREKK